MSGRIKVSIVEDSPTMQQLLSEIIARDPDLEIVSISADPYEAREAIKKTNPDVLSLDVEMPRMDGISFLEKIMALRPMPVLMTSSLTKEGADVTMRALELGAVDYITKPNNSHEMLLFKQEFIKKIKAAAVSKLHVCVDQSRLLEQSAPVNKSSSPEKNRSSMVQGLIFIGASTGGVPALMELMRQFPDNMPPILIALHMPKSFTKPFAERLNRICPMTVLEAKHEEKLSNACVYLAPGELHLSISRRGMDYYTLLDDGPLCSGHKPSVDVLFLSAAQQCLAQHAMGIILTGMGQDGAQGLLAMRQAGLYTLAQDEETSLIWGMPKAAIDLGAAEHVLSLRGVGEEMIALAQKKWGF